MKFGGDKARREVALLGLRVYFLVWLVFIPVLSSCSAPFWKGVAEGLESYGQNSRGTSTYSNSHVETVCVKFMTSFGWSHGYRVSADIMKASELNRRTSSYTYDFFSTYAVVFWDQGEASILKLESYFGSISAFGHKATDQRGLSWSVSSGLCY